MIFSLSSQDFLDNSSNTETFKIRNLIFNMKLVSWTLKWLINQIKFDNIDSFFKTSELFQIDDLTCTIKRPIWRSHFETQILPTYLHVAVRECRNSNSRMVLLSCVFTNRWEFLWYGKENISPNWYFTAEDTPQCIVNTVCWFV